MSYVGTRTIKAPIHDLFSLISNPENSNRIFPGVRSIEILSKPENDSWNGSRFRYVMTPSSKSRVVNRDANVIEGAIFDCRPPERMSMRKGNALILAEMKYELTQIDRDVTNLQITVNLQYTHWLTRWIPFLSKLTGRLAAEHLLDSIRRVAESDAR
jgi:hypothetical protein